MPIRRFLTSIIVIFSAVFLLTLSPLAQTDEPAGSVLAVSTYDIANDRSQLILLSVADDTVSRLYEPLLPLDSGITVYGYGLSLSPDAQRIAYPSFMNEGRNQLFVYDLETDSHTPLIDDPDNEYAAPAFSPDGTAIAFAATADGLNVTDIYTSDTGGAAVTPLTQTPEIAEEFPAWSPDGLWISYTVALESTFQIFVIPAEGGESRVVYETELPLASVTWSPDGSRLFFVSQTPDELGTAIYSVNLNGDDLRTEYDPSGNTDTAPGIDWLAFSPDGTRLVFAATEYVLSNTGTMTTQATLRVLLLDSGEVEVLPWDFGTTFITGLDWQAASITD
jgi:Tol biopolymer transport system component